MGSRWYRSSRRMRIATMKTEVDTAARGREKRRMSRWPAGSVGLLAPLTLRVSRQRAAWTSPREAGLPAARPEDTENPVVHHIPPSLRYRRRAAEPEGLSPRGERLPGTSRPAPGLPAHTRYPGRVPVPPRVPRIRGSHPAHALLRGAHPVPPTPPRRLREPAGSRRRTGAGEGSLQRALPRGGGRGVVSPVQPEAAPGGNGGG